MTSATAIMMPTAGENNEQLNLEYTFFEMSLREPESKNRQTFGGLMELQLKLLVTGWIVIAN
jgi:hypothetical protein